MTGKFSYAANTIPESLTLDPATGATTTTPKKPLQVILLLVVSLLIKAIQLGRLSL